MQKRGAERRHVELHIREQMRHFDRMREVRLAGKAHLRFVLLGGEIVGAAEESEIVAGTVLAHLVQQLGETHIHGPPGRDADHGFAERIHVVPILFSLSRKTTNFPTDVPRNESSATKGTELAPI